MSLFLQRAPCAAKGLVTLKGKRSEDPRQPLPPPSLTPTHITFLPQTKSMEDSDGLPIFAFQDLDYIPSGFGGVLAPYIETTAGTMRAAATLMRLGLVANSDEKEDSSNVPPAHQQVVCDLGCGDGYFRRHLLHIPVRPPPCVASSSSVASDPETTPQD